MTKARTLADNFAADINGITAGTGITGGGTSGTVTVTNSMATAIDAKGDLVVGTGADTFSRLAVASTAGYLLSVDSAETTGLKWAAPAAGGGPTFSAYLGSTQSITGGVFTKVQANTEEWDTDSCYNTTDYRFTPNKAGKYLVNTSGVIGLGSPDDTTILYVYKNGSAHKYSAYTIKAYGGNSSYWAGACVVTMNGTTDYIEMYQYFFNANRTLSADLASWNWNATWIAS